MGGVRCLGLFPKKSRFFFMPSLNKTQCQLCKRLAGPFIPLSWSCLVWKRILLWLWSIGGRQQPFSCVLGHFRHGHEQTNNGVNLVQACSWPVWEGSLLQYLKAKAIFLFYQWKQINFARKEPKLLEGVDFSEQNILIWSIPTIGLKGNAVQMQFWRGEGVVGNPFK